MKNLVEYALQTKYDKVKMLRNNLEEFNKILNLTEKENAKT